MSIDYDRLASFRTIEITTFGRKSGLPSRIEIWWFRIDGRFVITGSPGRRDWFANVKANQQINIHVDGQDLEAVAVVIGDPVFRKEVMSHPETSWYSTQAELDRLVRDSPMIEVLLSCGP